MWIARKTLVIKINANLWEIRSRLAGKNSRVLLTIQENVMVVLRGVIKKDLKISASDK